MDYVKKYGMISAHDMIVAGVSGGADSVCLLFMLLEIRKQIPFTLKVVHVNHGIHKAMPFSFILANSFIL